MNDRIRTVVINNRGQIVIPEEIRRDLNITGNQALVLIEKGREIILRNERDVFAKLTEKEDGAWGELAKKALAQAWDEEADKVWDKIARKSK